MSIWEGVVFIVALVLIGCLAVNGILTDGFNKRQPWVEVSKGVYIDREGRLDTFKINAVREPDAPKGAFRCFIRVYYNTPPVYDTQYATEKEIAAGGRIWPIAKGQKMTNATTVEVYDGEAHFLNK